MIDGSGSYFADKILKNLATRNSFLHHRVPFTDGNGLVLQCLRIDSNTEGSSGFILPAIAPADSAAIIIKYTQMRAKL
jgi:hypothetical protein